MPKKQAGENSKKVAGNAKKAEAAAAKQAVKDKAVAKQEDAKWQEGSKDNKKAEAAAAKAAEAARKKAEKDALLKEEEANQSAKGSGSKNAKTAQKKTRGIDSALSSLDSPSSALNASGIDNALDALSLTSNSQDKVDRHPERRFPAAYKAFEERRLDEMKDEKGLRRQQKIDQIRKEFEKHPDNPFNQVNATYNMSKEEVAQLRASEKAKLEQRLGS